MQEGFIVPSKCINIWIGYDLSSSLTSRNTDWILNRFLFLYLPVVFFFSFFKKMPNVQQVFLPRRMKKGSSVWSVKKVKVLTHLHPRKKQRNVWEVNDHSPGKVLLDYIHILVYKMSEKPDFHPSKVQRVQSNVVKMICLVHFFNDINRKATNSLISEGGVWHDLAFLLKKNKTKNDFLFFFF